MSTRISSVMRIFQPCNIILILVFLLLPVGYGAFGQNIIKQWPTALLKRTDTCKSELVGTIHGDTVFHYLKKADRKYYRYNHQVYEVIPNQNGTFRVDYFFIDKHKSKTLKQSSFYDEDSILSRTIEIPGDTTGLVEYYATGKVKFNLQKNGAIRSVTRQDSTGENYTNIIYDNDTIREITIRKDTIIYGLPMLYTSHIRQPNDTLFFVLKDTLGRTWKWVKPNNRIERKIVNSDTVLIETRDNFVISKTVFKTDSIIYMSWNKNHLFNLSASSRADNTGYLKTFKKNELIRGSETWQNKHGVESKSYTIKDGEEIITSTAKDLPNNRTVYRNFNEGKLVSKAISEYDGKGQWVKTTSWVNGAKSVQTRDDLSLDLPPGRCTDVPVSPRILRLEIEHLSLIVDDQKIEKINRESLFFKIHGYWLNVEKFEELMAQNYNHVVLDRDAKLEFTIKQKKGKAQHPQFNYEGKALFKEEINVEDLAYDEIEIDHTSEKAKTIKLTLHLRVTDELKTLKAKGL